MEALVNGLLAVVRTTVKKDLQFTAASSVLLLKQVRAVGVGQVPPSSTVAPRRGVVRLVFALRGLPSKH